MDGDGQDAAKEVDTSQGTPKDTDENDGENGQEARKERIAELEKELQQRKSVLARLGARQGDKWWKEIRRKKFNARWRELSSHLLP